MDITGLHLGYKNIFPLSSMENYENEKTQEKE
jgi:hypothetical protein